MNMMRMDTFEYKYIRIFTRNFDGLEDRMNELGAEGWELVYFAEPNLEITKVHAIYKRRIYNPDR